MTIIHTSAVDVYCWNECCCKFFFSRVSRVLSCNEIFDFYVDIVVKQNRVVVVLGAWILHEKNQIKSDTTCV